MLLLIILVIGVLIALAIFRRTQIPQSAAVANWHSLIDDFHYKPEEFYTKVESLLHERQIPDIKVSRKSFSVGGMFSEKRLYLEVTRKDKMFHLCAAPFGTGFFVSWWLREKDPDNSFWAKIPILGAWVRKRYETRPYYYWDAANMFKLSMHQSVMAVLDGITSEKGVRALSESERQLSSPTPTGSMT